MPRGGRGAAGPGSGRHGVVNDDQSGEPISAKSGAQLNQLGNLGPRAATLVRALRRETDPLFRQAGLNLDDARWPVQSGDHSTAPPNANAGISSSRWRTFTPGEKREKPGLNSPSSLRQACGIWPAIIKRGDPSCCGGGSSRVSLFGFVAAPSSRLVGRSAWRLGDGGGKPHQNTLRWFRTWLPNRQGCLAAGGLAANPAKGSQIKSEREAQEALPQARSERQGRGAGAAPGSVARRVGQGRLLDVAQPLTCLIADSDHHSPWHC